MGYQLSEMLDSAASKGTSNDGGGNMGTTDSRDVPFDIKQRTFMFGVRVIKLVGKLPRTVAGIEVGR
jgi:hypothetical protein